VTDNLLIKGVDTPPAPSLPLPTEVRHNNKSLHWRQVFRSQVAGVIAQYREASGTLPKVKEIVAYFPFDNPDHCWPDGTPIKNRRRIWVQECRKALGGKRKGKEVLPLLEVNG